MPTQLLKGTRSKLAIGLFILLGLCSGSAFSNGMYGTFGYYSLQSKTSTKQQTIQNFGHGRFIYEIELGNQIVFRPAYSLYLLRGSSSIELGYGTDLEFSYTPFTSNRSMRLTSQNVSWETYEIFRPYVSISFNQRQYQSIQSNYAGIGAALGTTYQHNKEFSLIAYMASLYLNGPLTSTIQEFQMALGFGLQL